MAVQNKFEVLGKAEKVDQQWIRIKVLITQAVVEQIQESKGKQNKSG